VSGILKEVKPHHPQLLAEGLSSSYYAFKDAKRRPFKHSLERLTHALKQWTTDEQLMRLTALSGRDYAVDRIAEISVEQHDGYVYDLRVPNGENFLCGHGCVHNCIDEIEKMNPQDRSSIHEILEQQRLSVAKAGITATLQARCALLAAANPKFGRFDEHKYISEQIDLPVTLLSRFDSIFPIMDRPESSRDRAMADHILKAHLVGEMRRKQEEQEPSLTIDPNLGRPFEPHFPPEFLRKYVAYAKRVYPIMTPDAMKVITDKYL
jgi:replicative DNA helicase Mcm